MQKVIMRHGAQQKNEQLMSGQLPDLGYISHESRLQNPS